MIPLLGEMSQSDKRVAVFAEKPSPADIQETFVFRRRDTACRVRSGNQTLPINFSYRGNKHFRRGRLPRRPIHKNCITIFVWTRHAVSLRQRCYKPNTILSFIALLYCFLLLISSSVLSALLTPLSYHTERLLRRKLCLLCRLIPPQQPLHPLKSCRCP